MGTRPVRSPGYLLHKPTGQTRVRIRGRDYSLGRHNSPASWKRYHQLIAQYLKLDAQPLEIVSDTATSIAELVACYAEFAEVHFRHNSDARYRIKAAVSPLVETCGAIDVDDFSPKKLKDVR